MKQEHINKKYILFFFLFSVVIGFIFFSLNKTSKVFNKCGLKVYRFEQEFFNLSKDSFDLHFIEFKKKYPHFFSDVTENIKNEVFLNDSLRQVLDSVNHFFHGKLPQKNILESGYCNYKSYFPLEEFEIYTFIDQSFDYRVPVVYADGKLFISLHLFLGSNHSFYNFLPDYIRQGNDTTFLPASCFITLAGRHIPYPQNNNFLGMILHYSKAYFFAKKMLPEIEDYRLFKCSRQKMLWCENNESAIWHYMIDKDYLFSSSSDLVERFISLAPFSQFGMPSDNQSPGGVGVWLGLQIWQAYASNNSISLMEVLGETDYMKVLNNSGYKP